jgi:hypothetical protein
LIFAVLAAAFGSSFQFGYHIGNINLPADLIKDWFSQSHEQMTGQKISADDLENKWWKMGKIILGKFIYIYEGQSPSEYLLLGE